MYSCYEIIAVVNIERVLQLSMDRAWKGTSVLRGVVPKIEGRAMTTSLQYRIGMNPVSEYKIVAMGYL